MSVSSQDVCIVCSKTIKHCHKDITCNKCQMYVHKKCTKLKPKELKKCKEWTCDKCLATVDKVDDSYIQDIDDACDSLINSFNVSDVDLENRFRDKCFNPLRYESIEKNEVNNGYQYNECSYITPDRFVSTMPLRVR